MVDKKDSFDEEFDFDDEFPSFEDDSDDTTDSFHFNDDEEDDDEDGSFDFSDNSDNEVKSTKEPDALVDADDTYEFEDIHDTDDSIDESDGVKKSNIFEQVIAKIKAEEPKKLVIYGSAAFFILVMLVFFVMKQFSSSSKPVHHVATTHKVTKTKANNMPDLNAAQTVSSDQIDSLGNNDATQASLPAPVSTQQAANLPVPDTMTTQPSAQLDDKTEKTITDLVTENKQLKQTVESMQVALMRAGDKYNNLEQQMQSSNARITNMERSIAHVESQMSKVNNALQAIVAAATSQSAAMPSGYVSNTSGGGIRTTYQAPSDLGQANVYYIQAIIPGRAWIRTSNGQTITVTYNDEIAGLGKVTKIDAENGLVVTSSGAKIAYGINEG